MSINVMLQKSTDIEKTIDKPGPHFGSILIHHTHMQTDIDVLYRQFHL